MGGFQQVDVARNQFDSKGLELAIQSMTQNLNNFYSTGTINEIGAIVAYGGALPPTGFLLCDGSAISRVTFSALFAVLGTTYGAGDGSTTFNLPNLKGKVPVGRDSAQTEFDTLGETGGAKTHTLSVSEVPNLDVGTNRYDGAALQNTAVAAGPNYQGIVASGAPGANRIYGTTTNGGGGAHNNLQPYQVVNYIIRYALPAGATNGVLGYLARYDQAGSVSFAGTAVDIFSTPITVTNNGGGAIRLVFDCSDLYTTVAVDRIKITFYEDGVALKSRYQRIFTAGIGGGLTFTYTFQSAPGNHSYQAKIIRDVGTGTGTMYGSALDPIQMTIEKLT